MYSQALAGAAAVPAAHQSTWLQVKHLIPIGVVGLISWSVWLSRFTLSRLYRPVPPGFTTSTSVVVPSFREDPDILDRCLNSWLAQGPTEVIVVPDLADVEVIGRLRERAASEATLHVVPFAHQGKRSALGVGIRRACSEILVLADSDTEWEPGLLAAVQAPFEDPKVGGVGTRQKVYLPETSVWRRVANWMIDVRYLDYVPSQSRGGAVACQSGRTVAYRRHVVMPVLDHLEHEFFLGRRCVSGDDGRLTWLVLASGYKTVYQSTAGALSMFPDTGRAFIKQRLRWSRNSYRCYLTAMWKGWLWRRPFICQLTVLQVMLTPVTMGFAMTYLSAWLLQPQRYIAAIAVGWLLTGRAVRGVSQRRQTGLHRAFFGEGIYVGSAHDNWCKYTGCRPDTSNDNVIADNDIADTTAENIDIKEGTTGGTISGNHFDGSGMVASAATAWVNVKGNHWTIAGNYGTNSIGDGFSVHKVYPGWGLGNIFTRNHAAVHGPGYGIYVQSRHLGTIVSCTNIVTSTGAGFSNIACTAS